MNPQTVENAFGFGFILGMMFGAGLTGAGAMVLWVNRQAWQAQGRWRR